MQVRLYSEQKVRVTTGHEENNFIDVKAGKWERGIEVSFLRSNQYFEVRKKDGFMASFYFENKNHKKDYDFGWWQDAEVVFSNNDD